MLESYFSLIALKKELTQCHFIVHRAGPRDRPTISPFRINSWCWLGLLILPRCSALRVRLFPLLFAVSSQILVECVILWESDQVQVHWDKVLGSHSAEAQNDSGSRGGSGWILGKVALLKGLSSPETGCPRQCWSPHLWRCSQGV